MDSSYIIVNIQNVRNKVPNYDKLIQKYIKLKMKSNLI